MALPDMWTEQCRISISLDSGAFQTFEALTETVDIDLGEKGVEFLPDMAGGRIAKYNPQEETTITFEAYPTEVGTTSTAAGSATGFFDLMYTNSTTTEPQSISADKTHQKAKIVLLWDNTGSTLATEEITISGTSEAAMRFVFSEAFITSIKPSFTDGVLKFTVEAKVPAFNKTGTSTMLFESVSGDTEVLPVVSA
jgi:hypothetical protein